MADYSGDVKLTGLDGVLRMLQELPPEVVSKRGGPVRAALRRGALVILKQAKLNVPVDSGALRDALIVIRGKPPAGTNGERYLIRVGGVSMRQYVKNKYNIRKGRATQSTSKSYEVEDLPAVYGRFLEYGTSKMAAQPWARPAFAAKAAEAISVTEQELLRAIDRISRKLARQSGAI